MVHIREKAKRCEFSNTDERVQEQFIKGCSDEKVKRRAVRRDMELSGMVNETSLNETFKEPRNRMISEVDRIILKVTKHSSNGRRDRRLCYFCRRAGHIVRDCMKLKDHRCEKCEREGQTG